MQQALIETNLAQQPHRLTLDSRSRLSITGVLEVESFDDTEILLTSTRGPMSIRGQGLHLQQLSIDGGASSYDRRPSVHTKKLPGRKVHTPDLSL